MKNIYQECVEYRAEQLKAGKRFEEIEMTLTRDQEKRLHEWCRGVDWDSDRFTGDKDDFVERTTFKDNEFLGMKLKFEEDKSKIQWVEDLAASWEKIAEASFDPWYPFYHIENTYSTVHKMLAKQLREDAAKNGGLS